MLLRFWLLIFALAAGWAQAGAPDIPPPSPCQSQLCWQIEPTVCIAEQSSDSCRLDFRLHWQSPAPVSVCAELAGQSLHCWQQQFSGQLQHQTVLNGPVRLSLQAAGETILTQELSVLSRQPSRRKRLVAPWSVF